MAQKRLTNTFRLIETEPPKVLKNKKADVVGIKTGLCPDAIQRRNRWLLKAKAVGI